MVETASLLPVTAFFASPQPSSLLESDTKIWKSTACSVALSQVISNVSKVFDSSRSMIAHWGTFCSADQREPLVLSSSVSLVVVFLPLASLLTVTGLPCARFVGAAKTTAGAVRDAASAQVHAPIATADPSRSGGS